MFVAIHSSFVRVCVFCLKEKQYLVDQVKLVKANRGIVKVYHTRCLMYKLHTHTCIMLNVCTGILQKVLVTTEGAGSAYCTTLQKVLRLG